MRLDAYRLYLGLGAVSGLVFSMIFTVLNVYYVQQVGMNPLQLVLVGTVLEGTILFFEVPTGIVADAYSRRLSVVIGYLLIGFCYLIQGFAPLFVVIIGAEMVRGVGETFISGAASAWIADEIGEERLGHAYLRYGQVARIGSFAGIALGTGLAVLQLNLPIYLGGGLLIAVGVFLALSMPETGFQPHPRRVEQSHWQNLREIAQAGLVIVRGRPVVRMLVLVGVVFGAFSEGFDRLWEAHFLTSFTLPAWAPLEPVVWIGIINGGGMLAGLLVSEFLIRRWQVQQKRRLGRLLFFNTVGLSMGVLAFGLAPNFGLAVGIFWFSVAFRSLQSPVARTWLNQHLPPNVRATVLSMMGQADALGQLGGGPIVGAVGLRSLRHALVFSGVLLTPAAVIYGRGARLDAEEPLVADAALLTTEREEKFRSEQAGSDVSIAAAPSPDSPHADHANVEG